LAQSAFERAKTVECKNLIETVACKAQNNSSLTNGFYKMNLKGLCPISNNELANNRSASLVRLESDFFKGCSTNKTYITNRERAKTIRKLFSVVLEDSTVENTLFNSNVTSLQKCIDTCLYMYKFLAFNQILNECFCLRSLEKKLEMSLINKTDCEYQVGQNNSELFEIYSTGSIGD
jgi:hypothetical protein